MSEPLETFTWRGITFKPAVDGHAWYSEHARWWLTRPGDYWVALLDFRGETRQLTASGITPHAALDALALRAANVAEILAAALREVSADDLETPPAAPPRTPAG
jgi:hypothetical protein